MKLLRSTAILSLALALLLPPALARGGGSGGHSDCGAAAAIVDLPYQTLDADERSALVYMREEEKLARDAYLAMDDRWGLRIFRNISRAEQAHMDVILTLLEKYDVSDPVGDNAPGEFTNPELQTLYNELIAQGNASLNEALIVGATIEDLDIRDLAVDLTQIDNEDIATAFQNLQKASRNHMRAFISLLEANGVDYEPEFISVEELEAIVESPRERGMVDAQGDPVDGSDCDRPRSRHHRGPHRHNR